MSACAYFVKGPRTIADLTQPHPMEQEREYEIVKTITLAGIDYENFTTDMRADRTFLEKYSHLCGGEGAVVRCLLVKRRKTEEGILVVPKGAWVDMAAPFL